MAGVDTEYDGTARPLPGASIGYLPQEPELAYETVQECIDEAVQSSQAILDEVGTTGQLLQCLEGMHATTHMTHAFLCTFHSLMN